MPNSCGGRVVRCAGTRSAQRALIVIIVLFAGMWGPGAVSGYPRVWPGAGIISGSENG